MLKKFALINQKIKIKIPKKFKLITMFQNMEQILKIYNINRKEYLMIFVMKN